MQARSSFLALAALVAGCNETGRYPAQCGALHPGWRKPSDGFGVLAIINKVHLASDGSLKWNGKNITERDLRTFSATLPQMNPVPFTILEIDEGAPCGRVRGVRQILNEGAKCHQLGTCGEGVGPWAQIGDVIGPNGETYKYYPDGRSQTIQPTEQQRAALNELQDEADAALQQADTE